MCLGTFKVGLHWATRSKVKTAFEFSIVWRWTLWTLAGWWVFFCMSDVRVRSRVLFELNIWTVHRRRLPSGRVSKGDPQTVAELVYVIYLLNYGLWRVDACGIYIYTLNTVCIYIYILIDNGGYKLPYNWGWHRPLTVCDGKFPCWTSKESMMLYGKCSMVVLNYQSLGSSYC